MKAVCVSEILLSADEMVMRCHNSEQHNIKRPIYQCLTLD